jgi:O-methyltransferase involved in polyketide biosynthesis
VARLYEYGLTGKDSLAADRELAMRFLAQFPYMAHLAAENREFLARVVTWAAEEGITQFIDLGCGLPATPNVHEVAQAACPGARVAYLDSDPVVTARMTAICKPASGVTVIERDLRDPGATLAAVAAEAGIDLSLPVCILMGAVLHFFDPAAARDVVQRFVTGVATGSCAAASIATGEGEVAEAFVAAYSAAVVRSYLFSLAELEGFFDGMEVMPPGVAEARTWRPDWTSQPAPSGRPITMYVAVARAGADATERADHG